MKSLDSNRHVFIIAEAGVNHNGSRKIAERMVDAASKTGADAIKFQAFKAENLVNKSAPKAEYQKTTLKDETQFAMLKKLELDRRVYKELMYHCKKRDILFLSSPFDLESIDLFNSLGVKIFKIPSGEITNS